MKLKTLWIATFALLLGASLHAQDLAGDWQATLAVPSQTLRIIVRLKAATEGSWFINSCSGPHAKDVEEKSQGNETQSQPQVRCSRLA